MFVYRHTSLVMPLTISLIHVSPYGTRQTYVVIRGLLYSVCHPAPWGLHGYVLKLNTYRYLHFFPSYTAIYLTREKVYIKFDIYIKFIGNILTNIPTFMRGVKRNDYKVHQKLYYLP